MASLWQKLRNHPGLDRHDPVRGKGQGDGGALADLTFYIDAALVHFDHFLDQSQTEAGTRLMAGHVGFGLGEGLNDQGDFMLGNTDAVIPDRKYQVLIVVLKNGQFDLAAIGGEFDRIGQQIY